MKKVFTFLLLCSSGVVLAGCNPFHSRNIYTSKSNMYLRATGAPIMEVPPGLAQPPYDPHFSIPRGEVATQKNSAPVTPPGSLADQIEQQKKAAKAGISYAPANTPVKKRGWLW